MQQRIPIAMALPARPTLLLADEPTTALDVIVQAEILRCSPACEDRGADILFISHDFRTVAEICERVGVMYAGDGRSRTGGIVLHRPEHPYTSA